jgi:hypothetical protein
MRGDVTPKQFERYLRRDKGRCWHCGSDGADLIPHHRLNRGFGGKNAKADGPANIIVMCAQFNGLMESDASSAAEARRYGWKIESWQQPDFVPIYEAATGDWWFLENDFTKTAALNPERH